jgi:hypothetical protein
MSYTTFEGIATCEVKFDTVGAITQELADYVIANSQLEECEYIISECGESSEELMNLFEPYLTLNDGQLTVIMNSESDDGNYSSAVWNFLIGYLCEVQTSRVMEVRVMSDDSREGMSSDLFYYTSEGSFLSVNELLDVYLNQV